MASRLKVTLVKSGIGRPEKHKKILQSLGLTKLNKSKVFDNTPTIRGMIIKINHLLKVEEYLP
jgi:large subunit ribosomal protein L30